MQGVQLLSEYIGAESTVSTQGQGPAAYSGYMGAGGPVPYSEYMGARGHEYMGEGVQLLTVGTWGEGGVGAWGGGPVAYSGYMGARGHGYMGEGVQLLTVGT